MISNHTVQSCIDDARAITKIDFCVLDLNGTLTATTFDAKGVSPNVVASFAASPAQNQTVQNHYFFKIHCNYQEELILVARGSSEDAYVIGRLVAKQLEALIDAYQKRYDKNYFIQSLLLGQLSPADILNQAQKLHIRPDVPRIVFLIETKYEKDATALETIRNLFGQSTNNFITSLGENYIVLLKEAAKEFLPEKLNQIARTLVDMLNTEAMTQARVSYGTIVSHIKDVPISYQEAKTALEVGRSFYPGRSVLPYDCLGIGRLVYELPAELCENFLKEVLGNIPDDCLDEDILNMVHKLFSNNLNISETARQLYIHRNTLVYQLEKLHKATGLDVRTFEDAMTFQIAAFYDIIDLSI